MSVYFMQPVSGGPVKIGYSDDIKTRRYHLECRYRTALAVLATMPGGREVEQEIHRRFAHLRFGRTEQFRPGVDLMTFIGRPLLVGANLEAVEAMRGPLPFTVRGSAEWKAWVESGAKFNRVSTAGLIDAALTKYLRESGFTETPPER